jgi:hypothetical protein
MVVGGSLSTALLEKCLTSSCCDNGTWHGTYLRSYSFLWVVGNFGKPRGTNNGHGLLLKGGGNLLFDEIDQPMLNPCFVSRPKSP